MTNDDEQVKISKYINSFVNETDYLTWKIMYVNWKVTSMEMFVHGTFHVR